MPIACLPTQIAGQNAVWRTAAVEAIRADPAWANGNYTSPPIQGLRAAAGLLAVSGGIGPLAMERDYPTNTAAVAFWHKRLATALNETDANDLLYQLERREAMTRKRHCLRFHACDLGEHRRRLHQPAWLEGGCGCGCTDCARPFFPRARVARNPRAQHPQHRPVLEERAGRSPRTFAKATMTVFLRRP